MKLSKRSFHTTFGDEENQSGNMTSCLNQLEIKSTGNIKRSNSRINLTFKKPKYDLDDDLSLKIFDDFINKLDPQKRFFSLNDICKAKKINIIV